MYTINFMREHAMRPHRIVEDDDLVLFKYTMSR